MPRVWHAFLVLLIAPAVCGAQEPFSITDLGVPATWDADASGGINRAGLAAGSVATSEGRRAFVYDASRGGFIDLGTLGGDQSRANDINDAGVVVGRSTLANGTSHAFRYSASSGLQDIHALVSLGGANSSALGVNEAGDIVGWADTANGDRHAFLYRAATGVVTDLHAAAGWSSTSSMATHLDGSGRVIGVWVNASGHGVGFLYSTATASFLNLPALGGASSGASRIVEGRIVGAADADATTWRAVRYDIDGSVSDLGTLGGLTSTASDVNRAGRIVGAAKNAAGETRAFVYDAALGMSDLNDALTGSEWYLLEAQGINDGGQIVGVGYRNSDLRLFLLTPPADTVPPALSLPAPLTVTAPTPAGAVVNYVATATDAVDGPVPVTCAPPPGSTFAVGDTTVSCSAADAAGNTASGNFTIRVLAPPPPPQPINLGTFSSGPVFAALRGSFTFALPAGSTLPPGLSLRTDVPPFFPSDAHAGIIGLATTPGTYTFTLLRSGVPRDYRIRVVSLAIKDNWTLPDAFRGNPYSYAFAALDVTGATAWSVGPSATLPPGMSLSPSGVLSGAPTAAGVYTFSVHVSDAGAMVARPFTLHVHAIQITTPGSLPNATRGVPYSAAITAVGGAGGYTFTADGFPEGLTLHADGRITGTPAGGDHWWFDVTVRDANGASTTKLMSLVVVDTPPALPGIYPYDGELHDCSLGTPCSQAVMVTQGGRAPFTWTASGLPPGMDIRSGSGVTTNWVAPENVEIWGTPTQLGTFQVRLTATDADGRSSTNTFQLRVRPLDLDFLFNGMVGTAYSHRFRVVGGRPPYTAVLAGGRLPLGLTFDPATLTVSGMPLEAGDFSIVLEIADADGVGIRRFNFFFIGTTSGIRVLDEVEGEMLLAGQRIDAQLRACCAAAGYVWSIESGTPPPGLTLSPSGFVSGTIPPGTAGTFTFVVRVADAANPANAALRQFTVVVTPLTVSSNLPEGSVGTPYSGSVSASGGTGITWSLDPTEHLPPGLVVQPDGAITGTPTATGQFSFELRATDSSGHSVVFEFNITIDQEAAPVARSVAIATQQGAAAAGVFPAVDRNGDPLTFSIVTPPMKGTLVLADPATGAFTYTPEPGTVGYDSFTFAVSDGSGSSTATGSVFIVADSPRWPGQTVRASVAPDGNEQAGANTLGAMSSADGRFIAFSSGAIDEATGTLPNVFVHDRQTGQTTLASRASGSDQAIGGALPWITPDGRYVAFTSLASGLPGGHPSATLDAYVHDRQTGETTRVSVASDGTPGNGENSLPVLSADGRYVAFNGRSTNLVATDPDDREDVYLRDRHTGQTTLVSVDSAGVKGNAGSWRPTLSADGRFIAFNSSASNLVPNDTNGHIDVFLRDLQTGQTTRVSVGAGGAQADGDSLGALGADGRFVVLGSTASNLVPGDTNGFRDVFVRDLHTGQITRVSVSSTGAQSNGDSDEGSLSADGRFVAFRSSASNLVAGDTNGLPDEFVHDRLTGQTVRVNVAADGSQANAASTGDDDGCCILPVISADGRSIVITSLASNLVAGDTNNSDDVFVVGPVLVDPTAVHVPAGGGARTVAVSVDYSDGMWTAATSTPWITLTSPAGGSASGTVTFTVAPNPGAARTGTLVVALQTVTVQQDASSPPVAQGGTLTTLEDTSVDGMLSATDPHGEAITFSIVTQPVRGTVVLTNPSTGAFTYTPAANAFGGDSFTFQASAGGESSNVATVSITITPVNDGPLAFDATLDAVEDTPATGSFVASDTDSFFVTFTLVSPPAHGTVVIPNPVARPIGGSYVYTPDPNYHGPDSFTFRVEDGGVSSNVATVTISVAPVNDVPVASAVVVTTREGNAVGGTLRATDADGDDLTFSLIAPPNKGALTITDPTTGSFLYTPNPGALGQDTFSFAAADGDSSATAAGIVFIVAAPRWPGQTVRASISTGGAQGNATSGAPSLSADGRYVAFHSLASSLVEPDTFARFDIFVRDRQTGQTTRETVATDGGQTNHESFDPVLSADGRFVAFRSRASNLVAGDTNGFYDIFVRDRQTGATTRVSVATDGTQANADSYGLSMSADARYIAFYSHASNLVPNDTNGFSDVFVHDRQTGQTTRVNVASDGTQANGTGDIMGSPDSIPTAMSADGRIVAFRSLASNLVADDTNGVYDVFVHDRQTGQTTRVSVATGGIQASAQSHEPALSADGRFVAFQSGATNLVPGFVGANVFVHDRLTGETTAVSRAQGGAPAIGSARPALSADGRYVAFESAASNVVDGDTNGQRDIFVHDRETGENRIISVAGDGTQANNLSAHAALSADGRFMAFSSSASNLVPSDTNNQGDVFVVGGVLVSPTAFSIPSGGGSRVTSVTFDYPGTPWAATTATPWITLTPPAGGSGNGTIQFSVAPNPGPVRTGTITAGLQTITITQDGSPDVVPPTVSAPANITIYAVLPGGATAATVSALGAFLLGATAVDAVTPSPEQLPSLLNGAAITDTTVFAIGANTVTFRFRDAAGNVGAATSVVTVIGGRPQLSVRADRVNRTIVVLTITNTGTGNAINPSAALSNLRTLAGSGSVTLSSGLPRNVPILAPGALMTTTLTLNVPTTVLRYAITERLTMSDYTGATLSTTATQTIFP